MKKVIVGTSGGVDSAVTAYLLKAMGYEVIGVTLRTWLTADGRESRCCEIDDAQEVARQLEMPYYAVNCLSDFRREIVTPFVDGYLQGVTPNPCVVCNRRIKWEGLLHAAQVMGADYVATGHYARIDREEGKLLLRKAPDPGKDQSYVLYMLTQEQLAHTVFPLGGMTKEEVRAFAAERGFVNSEKRESQDICFVPDGDYVAFLKKFTGHEYPSGDFVDKEGKVLGTHKGIVAYTPGQRRGLGLALPAPMYVSRLDVKNNRVILVYDEDLRNTEALVDDVNWISGEVPTEPVRVQAKLRYHQKEQWATAHPLEDGKVKLVFDEPIRAITPGQAAVFYNGDEVLGGGTIVLE